VIQTICQDVPTFGESTYITIVADDSEHLLFMGTKKFPSENEYQQYLSTNNGMSNAYTAMTSTNYYFDVAPNALEGALDRFSGFFIEPLFNEDCTEREIKAVDSEHKKNLQNDMWVSALPTLCDERC